MPFKVFTNAVPLPASDLNDYLMEQSISTFADSSARSAALVSPTEGQVTYLADTDSFEYWNSSAWSALSGGMTLLSTTTLTGATVTLSSIPQTYKDLRLVVKNFRPSADANLQIRINGLSTAVYANGGDIPTGSNQWNMLGGTQDSGATNQQYLVFTLYDYASTTTWKVGQAIAVRNDATTPSTLRFQESFENAAVTAAITSMDLFPASGTFTSGTAYLYGVN